MPEREAMARNRWLAPIAHRFLTPELWRFTRRSVPRGVALGLFCGFIIPIGQIFLAAFMALPARANVPLAVGVTFITNPLTFPFWLYVANRVGARTLSIDTEIGGAVIQTESLRTLSAFFETAGVTVFGFVVMAIVSAILGYIISSWLWRLTIARRRGARLRAMEDRMEGRLSEAGE